MKTNELTLKPCPFCGSADVEVYSYDPFDGYQGDLTRWTVVCTNCGCEFDKKDKQEVIDAWNRRDGR